MTQTHKRLPPLGGTPNQHSDLSSPLDHSRRKGFTARFSDGFSPEPPGTPGKDAMDHASRPPSTSSHAVDKVVTNHYPRRQRPKPSPEPPVSTSPRSAWDQEQLPKIAEKSAALAVLPNTTYAQRTASPPAGGWKHWVPTLLSFDPPPPRSQGAPCGFFPTGSTSAPSSPPKSRGHDAGAHEGPGHARGRSSSGEYGAMNGDPRKAMNDVLNLWRGKRLNKAEIMLEGKLNTLRQNPTARMQLEDTVRLYFEERKAVAEQLAARAQAKEAQKGRNQHGLMPKSPSGRTPGSSGGAGAGGLHTMRSRRSPAFELAPSGSMSAPMGDRLALGMGSPSKRWGQSMRRGADGGLQAETSGGGLYSHHSEGGNFGSRRFTVYQVTLSEWRTRRKQYSEVQLRREEAGAVAIQAAWRGWVQCMRYRKMRRCAIKIQRALRLRYQEEAVAVRKREAAAIVLHFLQTDCREGGIGNLKLMRQAFIRQKRADKNLQILYTMRVALLARQWAAVEKILITAAKRRSRSSPSPAPGEEASLAPTAGKKDKAKLMEMSLVARKRGILPGQSPDANDESRNLTPAVAVEGCHTNDRLIIETMVPVPKEVKGAIIACYLEAKQRAWFAVVGLYWLAMAQHRQENKKAEMLAAARSVVTNSALEPTNNVNKPKLTRMRILATVNELRSMMQQGVAETPMFHAYILKSNLDEYEAELQVENQKMRANVDLSAIVKAKKKQHAGPSRVPVSWAIATPQDATIEDLSLEDTAGAFTSVVTHGKAASLSVEQKRHARELKQVWWRDAIARAAPSLRRRWQLLRVDLVGNLENASHQSPEEMAAYLLDHRNNSSPLIP